MYSKINYTVVGLFVSLFTIALLAFGFWLAKYGFEEKYDRYTLYFTEPVDGLTLDSSVKLKGVDVGKVSSIEVDPENVERVRVMIRLREGTPITQGMYAVLKLQGITGLSYVQIEGGKKGAPPLRSQQGEAPVIPTHASLMQQLSNDAPALLSKLQHMADSLDSIFSESNRKHLELILKNSADATGKALEVEERIIALSEEFNTTLRNFNAKADTIEEEVRGLSSTLRQRLPSLLKNFDEAGASVAKVARGLELRLKRGEYDLKRIVRPLKIDIRELSYRYQELAEDLKALSRNPSSILFGSGHPMKGPGE